MEPKFSTVRFRNHDLLCLEQDDEVWVAMRPVVEGMGLSWPRQYRKLAADSDTFCVSFKATQIPGDDQVREHLFIPLEMLFGWLMTIRPSKVKPAIRPEIIAYRQECSRVLARHFAHELRAELDDVWRIHFRRTSAMREGWFKRFPHWEPILADYLNRVPRAETAAQLGCRPDTITRNRRRIIEAGLVH